jgi:hypothetical protein
MQAARRATQCFQQKLASSTRRLFRNRRRTDQNEMVRAGTLSESRKKAAAASLLVKSNVGSFLLRFSPRRSEFTCARIGCRLTCPAGAGGPNVSLAGLRTRNARPDNALFQGKLASGWPINRRDNREAVRIPLPGRMESVPVSALAGSCRAWRDPLANDYSAAPGARLSAPGLHINSERGSVVFGTK